MRTGIEQAELDAFLEKRTDTKPCPFCGGRDLSMDYDIEICTDDFLGFFIECRVCGARGGSGIQEGSAWLLWQTRADKTEHARRTEG